ncbi:MAG: DUF1772 domain-containing protein [Rhodospirillaceae bacterium]|nr:DUF1772 domain-containing protein [Rhodospirillaceae bacterium]
MTEILLFPLTLAAALGAGLIGGVFFAFSSFVMRALGQRPAPEAIAAMQAINIVVINPLFLGVFMGTAVLAAAVAILGWFGIATGGVGYLTCASALYLVGTFGVTMIGNVPLNNALAAMQPESAEAAALWVRYLRQWLLWNHVRMLAATLASAGFILAMRGGAPA